MNLPPASILWVNYNSTGFRDVVEDSLRSVWELDYPDYELIAVDNASTDGSFEVVKQCVERAGVKASVVRSKRNLGFAGGNNLAYKLVSKDSKYIVLLNNDAVAYPESLREIVEFMEDKPSVGATQGVIYEYSSPTIQTTGYFLTELLTTWTFKALPRKPTPITFPHGAFAVLKRECLNHVGLANRLFPEGSFSGLDDNYLGMKLWNHGYKVFSLPIKAARHVRSASFKRVKRCVRFYYDHRAWAARIFMTEGRMKPFALLLCLRVTVTYNTSRAVIDGYRLAKRIGEHFDINRMPIVKLPKTYKIPAYLLLRRLLTYDIDRCYSRPQVNVNFKKLFGGS
jgi:GT2 family glycosyltransferase